uniref:Uncharacterized protein n=1 Tax=Clostridioides difficile TaxID=1496 RepID=A0A381I7G5_CLODI|nr:Uncharacterised protein [Clostridioides difficile]
MSDLEEYTKCPSETSIQLNNFSFEQSYPLELYSILFLDLAYLGSGTGIAESSDFVYG